MKDKNIEKKEEKDVSRRYRIRNIILLVGFIIVLIILLLYFGFIMFKVAEKGTISSNVIDSGVVLFSYQEKSNAIEISNMFPMSDEEGKNLNLDQEYFDFDIYFESDSKKNKKIRYEIIAKPYSDNTLDSKYVKIYLEKKDSSGEKLKRFSELDNSDNIPNGKILYTDNLLNSEIEHFRLRMWIAKDYPIDDVARTFKIKIFVNGYVE